MIFTEILIKMLDSGLWGQFLVGAIIEIILFFGISTIIMPFRIGAIRRDVNEIKALLKKKDGDRNDK